jgi:hypothetical protein
MSWDASLAIRIRRVMEAQSAGIRPAEMAHLSGRQRPPQDTARPACFEIVGFYHLGPGRLSRFSNHCRIALLYTLAEPL